MRAEDSSAKIKRSESPDLEFSIRRVAERDPLGFTLELHAADPSFQIHRLSFGPVRLERGPAAWVAGAFEDIRNSTRLPSPRDVLRELESIGSELFYEVVPPELGQLLAPLQGRLETLLIESDEPWIPWKLLRLEKVEGARVTSGTFLCEAFATSRWLRGRALHDRLLLNRMALVARAFVEGKLDDPGISTYIHRQGLDRETFVDELVGKSQGNFMYLHHVLPAIAAGEYRNREFATLPVGLVNYYEDHWKLMRKRDEEAWFGYKVPILAALTVVREPLSVELIRDFSGVKQRSRIRDVLTEWNLFLYATENVDDEDRPQKRYRIYHASFQDFIADKEEALFTLLDKPPKRESAVKISFEEMKKRAVNLPMTF